MTQIAAHPSFTAMPMAGGGKYFIRSTLIIDTARSANIFLTSEFVGDLMKIQAQSLELIPMASRA